MEFGQAFFRKFPFFSGLALLITLLGLAIRIGIAPFVNYPFDIEHWAVILQNTESGNGLFGLTGYFYTPVWGYILGFEDVVINSLFSVEYGHRVLSLLGIEDLNFSYYTATTTSPAFNILMKMPLIIVDFLVGYIIYRMVLAETDDRHKAVTAYALWFMCPLVVYMSSVQAQFDCISALCVLLCVLLVRLDHSFLGGAIFMVGALIKFFPAFCVLILCIYVLRVKSDSGLSIRKFMLALVGALFAAVILFLPQIMDGTFTNAFSFIFGRTSEFDIFSALRTYPFIAITLVMMVVLAVYSWRIGKEELDAKFVSLVLLMLTICTLISSGPQYCIVYLPLLAYYIGRKETDRPLLYCFIIIGTMSAVSAFFNNSLSVLTTFVEYCGLWSPESLLSSMDVLETRIFGFALRAIIVAGAELIQTIAMMVVILLLIGDLKVLERYGRFHRAISILRVKLGGNSSE